MADYKGVLEDLKVRRASLTAEIGDLDMIIGKLESMSLGRILPTGDKTSFKGMTLLAAIQKALAPDGWVDTNEVVKTLSRGGFEFKAKRPYASVYSTLFRLAQADDGPVVHKDGKWALRSRD